MVRQVVLQLAPSGRGYYIREALENQRMGRYYNEAGDLTDDPVGSAFPIPDFIPSGLKLVVAQDSLPDRMHAIGYAQPDDGIYTPLS